METTKTQKTMIDLKELAWDEWGKDAYENEMRLRFMMDTWPGDDKEENNQNGGV